MEDLKSAFNDHIEQMAGLIERFSAEIRTGFQPAYENFMGFFHAIDWKEPWLICLISFHIFLLLITFVTRKNVNFQMCLFLMALGGVYLAEKINSLLGQNWKSFATQNYFDPHGLFLSVLWSGPLLIIAIIILMSTLFSLCHLIVRWKKAELRHRARLSQSKQD
ncbi:PREDICTED: transmembrane protein 18 [Nelumbo nucifera]|uniref:Transmembrane protein 18 n=2 Tax=Nelumbo nucifera TaxID=4432 RepID=A0A822Z6H6_NELNU|nr:PREDICTED: transmembrane protein 18 [Nelumbo nucifera]DAD39281.1 TPA_asm: hypothetical protein HUJ06_013604 [Nelumbo nucifera]